jgi:hypothetical protein
MSGNRNEMGGLGVDERIILKLILTKLDVDWIQLAQDRVWWLALVNTVIDLRVS